MGASLPCPHLFFLYKKVSKVSQLTLLWVTLHRALQVHLQSHAVVDNVEAYLAQVHLPGCQGARPAPRQQKLLRQMLRCPRAARTEEMRGLPEVCCSYP